MKKIIYIAGYSRSGSTILDIILSGQQNIFGTGELTYFFSDWAHPKRACTCGEPYSECEFWGDFDYGDSTPEEFDEILRKVESRAKMPDLMNGKLPKSDLADYAKVQEKLYNYIFEQSGCDVIIDSSKSSRDMAGRFYALAKHTNFDISVIHLLKNGESVVQSFVEKGRNWALEGYVTNDRFLAARSSMGWRLANGIAKSLGEKLPKEQYMQLRYEDLVRFPKKELTRISNFTGVDFSESISKIENNEPFQTAHNVGGNRLRLSDGIVFQTKKEIRPAKLNLFNRMVFKSIAGRLSRKFGYPIK